MVTENTPAAKSSVSADMGLLREAADAYKGNDKEKARALLVEATSHNPDNELVWMWRTSLARTVEEALEAVSRVLVLNPTNERALGWKAKLVARSSSAQVNGSVPAAATDAEEAAHAAVESAEARHAAEQTQSADQAESEASGETSIAGDREPAETASASNVEVSAAEASTAEGLEESAEVARADAAIEDAVEEQQAADGQVEGERTEGIQADDELKRESAEEEFGTAEDELEAQAAETSEHGASNDDAIDQFFAAVEQGQGEDSHTTVEAESRVESDAGLADLDDSAASEERREETVDADDDPLRAVLAAKAAEQPQEYGDAAFGEVEGEDGQDANEDESDRSEDKAASLAALLGAETEAQETYGTAGDEELIEISAEESQSVESLWPDDDATTDEASEHVVFGEDDGDDEEASTPTAVAAEPVPWQCPICEQQSHRLEMSCPQCRSIVDFSRLPAMAENDDVDRVLLKRLISDWEAQVDAAPSAEIHARLALAYLNLRQSNMALPHLLAGARLDRENQGLAGALQEVTRRPLIMVVDDSRTVQRMVSSTLERQLYRISIAEDGLQALAKLNDELPALILLDITMPRMDGYQVCKVISGNQAFKHIPVVMLSGKDGFFDKVRGKMVGASDYITKPFEAEFLVKAVRGRLQN